MVLGHIDHGKTTLLDKIRQTSVAEKETGGITQHIGAYEIKQPKAITFIDTPGHEAFSKMRSRGARVADIALLVVAADDGVKPQTEEALTVIQEAQLPFIVVLNKIDKEGLDLERVKKGLGDRGVILEEWGGKVPLAKVSAKTGQGIGELLELILLLAELGNLECDFTKPASGVVIESHLDSKRGQAATLLLLEGTLGRGDWILAGEASVKTKILEDFNGNPVAKVSASSPVRVLGFNQAVRIGATFQAFETKEKLEEVLSKGTASTIQSPRPQAAEGEKTMPLVLKADAAGSLEALEQELGKLGATGLTLMILRSQVGNITEDDVQLASANPLSAVLGFRVKVEKGARLAAERFGVRIQCFELIYELGDWLKNEIAKISVREPERKILGTAKIVKIFREDGSKKIVGGRVEAGGIFPQKRFRLLRRNFPLGEGKILELQSGRIKVREVLEGQEFGALAEISLEVAPGDKFEIFEEA